MPKRLIQRDGIWHYYRRVPERFRRHDPRTFVQISLETRDLKNAERVRPSIEREVEAYWMALVLGGSPDAHERYVAAIDRARLEGFEYRPIADLAGGDVGDILARLARLEELGHLPAGRAQVNGTAAPAAEALLGGVEKPSLTLSTGLEQFYLLTRDEVRGKSADQLRRWKAPRLKAVNNLIALVGDKPIVDITRADALALRAMWVERVAEEEEGERYTPNSANKDIGHLAQVFDTLNERLELGLGRPFFKLRLRDDEKNQRDAFSLAELRKIALDPASLAGLNEEARLLILALVETGMRPIEAVNLEEDDIRLDDDVPHVKIRAKTWRQLKTPYSAREIPLVGVSLQAMLKAPKGFPRYRDKSSSLSALVNKFLNGRGLLPTDNHSLYSLRHSFKSRLVAADVQDRIQDELMGHKSPRPVYGATTLAHKRDWLEKIAITADGAGDRPADSGDQARLPL